MPLIKDGERVIAGPFRTLRHLREGDPVEEVAPDEQEDEGDGSVTVSIGD